MSEGESRGRKPACWEICAIAPVVANVGCFLLLDQDKGCSKLLVPSESHKDEQEKQRLARLTD
jgi:hypothetical protein